MNQQQFASVGVISEYCNVSERRIQQLAKDGIVPKAKRGKYPLVETVRAYICYLQKLAAGENLPADTNKERARLLKVQAETAELALRERQGELIEVDQARELWAKHITEARAKFLSLPVKVSRQLEGQNAVQIKEKLQDAIYDALTSLAQTDGAKYIDK